MIELLLAAFGTSLLTGMRHATDPDHVVAVTTIVSRERSVWKAAGIGALWGLGHSLTILVVGTVVIAARLTISPRVGLSMEFAVALMLVTLGVLNLMGTRAPRVQTPGGPAPVLLPAGPAGGAPVHARRTLSPVVVGTVHGLAGSAAATLFATSLVPDPRWAIAMLVTFALATILGMMLVTMLLALPAAYAAARMASLQSGLRVVSGVASIGFGVWLGYQIGVADGLFGAAPRWDPH